MRSSFSIVHVSGLCVLEPLEGAADDAQRLSLNARYEHDKVSHGGVTMCSCETIGT